MDLILGLVELVMELVWWSGAGFIQAIAGMFWPSDDPQVRRMQRVTLVVVCIGLAATVLGFVLAYFVSMWHSITPFVVACACFVWCDFLGHRIERRCKDATRDTT